MLEGAGIVITERSTYVYRMKGVKVVDGINIRMLDEGVMVVEIMEQGGKS